MEFTETELVEIYYAIEDKRKDIVNFYKNLNDPEMKKWIIDLESIIEKITSEVNV